jgi:hypothetical protein
LKKFDSIRLAKFKNPKRHAIANRVHPALRWNAAEVDGYVIGFVISFRILLR